MQRFNLQLYKFDTVIASQIKDSETTAALMVLIMSNGTK